MLDYRYEAGEGRFKHKWKHGTAGFVTSGSAYIGKCPSDITQEIAEERLNAGVPVYDGDETSTPAKIYTIFRGVVYEAVPTNPGHSYHAYPWRGDLPEYNEWMKRYGG